MVIISEGEGKKITTHDAHSCQESASLEHCDSIIDARKDMEEMVDILAFTDASKFPKEIANEVIEFFKVKYTGSAWKFHTI